MNDAVPTILRHIAGLCGAVLIGFSLVTSMSCGNGEQEEIGSDVDVRIDGDSESVVEPDSAVVEGQDDPHDTTRTIVSAEVREGGEDAGVWVTFADGSTKQIAERIDADEVEDIHDIVSWLDVAISPDRRYLDGEASGFEMLFVQVYDAQTGRLHPRMYGAITDWTNEGRLRVRSCDLAGENCTDRISIDNVRPWLLRQSDAGMRVGDATLLPSTDLITNIRKVKQLSTFAEMLDAAGPDATGGTGPFTIFAPTNDAFAELRPGTVAELMNPANRSRLIDLVRNHIVAGRYNTVQLRNGSTLTTIGNDRLGIWANEWTFVKINDNVRMRENNIYADNGVMHIVDGVLGVD